MSATERWMANQRRHHYSYAVVHLVGAVLTAGLAGALIYLSGLGFAAVAYHFLLGKAAS